MPNNTTNILILDGSKEDIDKIHEMIFTRDEEEDCLGIDFNKIIPMPEELQVTAGTNGNSAYDVLHSKDDQWKTYMGYHWVKEAGVTTKEELIALLEKRAGEPKEGELSWRELGDRYASNLEKYGAKNWYDWCCDNWGTKWNSYSNEIEGDGDGRLTVTFDTAWSPPTPIYAKLDEMFPEVSVTAYWSDEGSYERSQIY